MAKSSGRRDGPAWGLIDGRHRRSIGRGAWRRRARGGAAVTKYRNDGVGFAGGRSSSSALSVSVDWSCALRCGERPAKARERRGRRERGRCRHRGRERERRRRECAKPRCATRATERRGGADPRRGTDRLPEEEAGLPSCGEADGHNRYAQRAGLVDEVACDA